jgi:Mrp family chromosome partitioning ATPase
MAVQTVRGAEPPPQPRRPLLVTADPLLLDELVRIAASVDVLLDVAADVAAARLRYESAPLVLVGVDLGPACVRAGLPRRRDLVVVGRHAGAAPPEWAVADQLAAQHIAALPAAEPWLASRLAMATRSSAQEWNRLVNPTPPIRPSDRSGRSRSGGAGQVGRDDAERIGRNRAEQPGPQDQGRDGWSWLDGDGRTGPGPRGGASADAGAPPAGPIVPGVTRGSGLVVAVVGGRGGAGASVFAAALAVTAARADIPTMLVDADPYGGGLDLVLGWEEVDGLRWPALRADLPAVESLPRQKALAALSFDRSSEPRVPVPALASTLAAGRRRHDLVVVDTPRRFDDAAQLALTECDHAYLVVPAELRSCAAAVRVTEEIRRHCDRLSVVVRGPAPGGLRAGDVTAALGLPLAGYLRPEPRLARDLESGAAPARDGRGPLARLCRQLLIELGVAA